MSDLMAPGPTGSGGALRVYLGIAAFSLLGAAGPWLRDQTGSTGPVVLLGLLATFAFVVARRTGSAPPTTRAKLGALLTSESVNTVVLVSGILLTDFARIDGAMYVVAMSLVVAPALLSVHAWRRLASRTGPKHLLDVLLLFWAVIVTVLGIYRPLDLPKELAFVVAPLMGATFAGIRTMTPLLAVEPSPRLRDRFLAGWTEGALVAPIAWFALAVAGAPVGAVFLLLAAALAGWIVLRPAPDPFHPGAGPLRGFSPWPEGGRPLPRGARRLVAAPFTTLFLLASWTLFLPFARPEGGFLVIDENQWRPYLYQIPDLGQDLPLALRSLLTAPFLNHDSVQLVYVTVLLGLFGLLFEAKEGSLRTVLLFFGTTFVGALVAGLLLHLLYPAVSTDPFFERAWERTWSGGSVGAFGLMGSLAARARVPWPLLAFFAFWELNVGWFYLRSYTPAFHLTALVTGFLVTRFFLRPWRRRDESAPFRAPTTP